MSTDNNHLFTLLIIDGIVSFLITRSYSIFIPWSVLWLWCWIPSNYSFHFSLINWFSKIIIESANDTFGISTSNARVASRAKLVTGIDYHAQLYNSWSFMESITHYVWWICVIYVTYKMTITLRYKIMYFFYCNVTYIRTNTIRQIQLWSENIEDIYYLPQTVKYHMFSSWYTFIYFCILFFFMEGVESIYFIHPLYHEYSWYIIWSHMWIYYKLEWLSMYNPQILKNCSTSWVTRCVSSFWYPYILPFSISTNMIVQHPFYLSLNISNVRQVTDSYQVFVVSENTDKNIVNTISQSRSILSVWYWNLPWISITLFPWINQSNTYFYNYIHSEVLQKFLQQRLQQQQQQQQQQQ